MIKISQENKRRLLRVKKRILKEPEKFIMREWAEEDEKCGTVCCIAGWLYVDKCGVEDIDVADIMENTQEVVYEMFGMDIEDEDIPLFFVSSWDVDLKEEYYSLASDVSLSIEGKQKRRAELAGIAIDRFIESYKDDSSKPQE